MNKKVVEIDWSSEKPVVKCQDGIVFIVDHVITTIPHGVLRKCYENLFKPSLPEEKVKAINGVDFGTLDKIFLEFEEKLIPEHVTMYGALWSKEDFNAVKGTDKEWYHKFLKNFHD